MAVTKAKRKPGRPRKSELAKVEQKTKKNPKKTQEPELQTIAPVIEKANSKAKAKATQNGEPYVQILGFELDPSNPTQGAFTLDWNEDFIKELQSKGFGGQDEQAIIDQWFKTVCYHVLKDTWADYQAQTPGNGRRTQTQRLTQDRVEVR